MMLSFEWLSPDIPCPQFCQTVSLPSSCGLGKSNDTDAKGLHSGKVLTYSVSMFGCIFYGKVQKLHLFATYTAGQWPM